MSIHILNYEMEWLTVRLPIVACDNASDSVRRLHLLPQNGDSRVGQKGCVQRILGLPWCVRGVCAAKEFNMMSGAFTVGIQGRLTCDLCTRLLCSVRLSMVGP